MGQGHPTTPSRRDLLRGGIGLAAGLAATWLLGPFGAAAPANQLKGDQLRVYVVSIDSLDPVEVTPDLMPNLEEVRKEGIWFESVSVLPSSSVQNHVAMFTGALPQRNGFVQNTLSGQQYQVDHLFTRLANEDGIYEATEVKTFFFTNWSQFNGLFSADSEERPQTAPAGGFDPDPATRFEQEARNSPPPQFGLLHLVDADTVAHAGHPHMLIAQKERNAAIKAIDNRLGTFFERLEDVWSETILFVVSDHRMEFANAGGQISVDIALNAAGYETGLPNSATGTCNTGDYCTISNEQGGLLIGVTDQQDIEPIAKILEGVEGIALVVTRQSSPSLADVGLEHPQTSDIVVFARAGYTFNSLFFGLHGHPLAQPNVLLVSGGHPWVAQRPKTFSGFDRPLEDHPADPVGRPSILSIAPTVAWLFDLPEVDYYANDRLPYAFNRSLRGQR